MGIVYASLEEGGKEKRWLAVEMVENHYQCSWDLPLVSDRKGTITTPTLPPLPE